VAIRLRPGSASVAGIASASALGGVQYSAEAVLLGTASVYASPQVNWLANANAYAVASVACIAERLGENWTDETFNGNTWVDDPQGSNTWTPIAQDSNTWTELPVSSNNWVNTAQGSNTWQRVG
jgi:hypothetical protein